MDGSDNVSCEEICAYLGVCVILSVNPARQLRHVFSSEPFLNNTVLHSVFTLWHFTKINHYFCVSDKTKEISKDNPGYDKLFKVRPVVEQLQRLFPKYWEFGHNICINESVISIKSKDGVSVIQIQLTNHTYYHLSHIWERNIPKFLKMDYSLM